MIYVWFFIFFWSGLTTGSQWIGCNSPLISKTFIFISPSSSSSHSILASSTPLSPVNGIRPQPRQSFPISEKGPFLLVMLELGTGRTQEIHGTNCEATSVTMDEFGQIYYLHPGTRAVVKVAARYQEAQLLGEK